MATGPALLGTEYARIGLEFARALAAGHFEEAQHMLTKEEQAQYSVPALKARYERMVAYGHGPVTDIEAMEGYDDYPQRKPNDIGGVYVAMVGRDFSEAVMVFVCREDGKPLIRDIIWGRP